MIRDMRDFIASCEKAGELKRIKAEVDWNLELSHISKLNEERSGPALLFENVKGYKTPVLSGALSTAKRLAITLGFPPSSTLCQQAREWMKLTTKKHIPPKVVSTGPVMENVLEGDKIDLLSLPVPKFYPMDGGRFIGTAVTLITQDPETGWTNLGTYRMQLWDKNHTCIQFLVGKHAELMLRKYAALGKPMPAAMVIGQAPINFLYSSTTAPANICEYDLIGAIQGEPVEVIKSDLTGLMIPATAEFVAEGYIGSDPATFDEEGPFGEYTGYYSGLKRQEFPKPRFEVKRLLHRNNPIFWVTSVGAPVTDTHMLGSVQVSASLWTDLEVMRVPGIQSVFCPPETTGRMWAIVSVKQMYPGHAAQVASAVAGSSSGHYRLKGIIVVEEDVAADDLQKVWWSLSTRFDPERDTHIFRRTRSTPLDPSLPLGLRTIGSKIFLDATIPFEWKKEDKPVVIQLDKDTKEKVQRRWTEYGFDEISW